MPSVKGKLVTCDRCETFIFLKHLGTNETDGGYTVWDKFEELSDEWLYETQIGYLCPECAGQFKSFITNFMNGKVAPAWKTTIVKEEE